MYKEVPLQCSRNTLRIRGMQYLPENFAENKKIPAVVISHGFTGSYADMSAFGRAFAALGYIAVCFSFCGASRATTDPALRSDGSSLDMTISTEVSDLCAVIDSITAQPFVDTDNLLLLGASQGGFVSGLAAAKCGDRIKKLIMIYPALCIPDHARKGCLGGSSYDPAHVPEKIHCTRTILGKKFHEDVVEMDPYQELPKYRGPVLILHGLNDTTVDFSYSVRARDAYRNGQCCLQLIENMGHRYDEQQFDILMTSIRQFIAAEMDSEEI